MNVTCTQHDIILIAHQARLLTHTRLLKDGCKALQQERGTGGVGCGALTRYSRSKPCRDWYNDLGIMYNAPCKGLCRMDEDTVYRT